MYRSVLKDCITRNHARLEVLGGSRGCSERLQGTPRHSRRAPEESGGLLEALGIWRKLWGARSVTLRCVLNTLEFRSVIFRQVFNRLDFRSVMLRSVSNTLGFRSVIPRRVFNTLGFRIVSRRCVFNILEFSRYILRRVVLHCSWKVKTPHDVFCQTLSFYTCF